MSQLGSPHKLKLIIFSVDGVFTDGCVWQDYNGSWRRYFSIRDTMGIRALKKAGYRVAAITSERSAEILSHMTFVGIEDFFEGCSDKRAVISRLLHEQGLDAQEAAYVTEDLRDLDVLKSVGYRFTLPTAAKELKELAHFVTTRSGGDGAVLEVCNFILQQRNKTNVAGPVGPLAV